MKVNLVKGNFINKPETVKPLKESPWYILLIITVIVNLFILSIIYLKSRFVNVSEELDLFYFTIGVAIGILWIYLYAFTQTLLFPPHSTVYFYFLPNSPKMDYASESIITKQRLLLIILLPFILYTFLITTLVLCIPFHTVTTSILIGVLFTHLISSITELDTLYKIINTPKSFVYQKLDSDWYFID